MVPGDGMNVRGFSAFDAALDGVAEKVTSSCVSVRGAPEAMRICSMTRSRPVIASVTVCSTCSRVFISMKKNSPVLVEELDCARAPVLQLLHGLGNGRADGLALLGVEGRAEGAPLSIAF
jgi:hypothetical protein